MARGTRSPFGELVFRHRRRLGVTQGQLANRISVLYGAGDAPAPVSERTIAGIERRTTDPGGWRSPRLPTVHAIARGLRLEPGSPDHDALLAAALEVEQRVSPAPASTGFLSARREAHLARLRHVIDRAAAGSPAMVMVQGAAGAGKTWLIEEAARTALARHPGMAVLWAHRPEPESTAAAQEPHATLRQHLRLMLGDLDLASPRQLISDANRVTLAHRVSAAARTTVAEAPALLARFAADLDLWRDGSSACVDPDLCARAGALIRQPAAAWQDGVSVSEQFARLVTRYAAEGPLLLVVDDLHWADAGSLSAIAQLAGWLRDRQAPVALLGTLRPGYAEGNGAASPLDRLLRRLERLYPRPLLDLSTAAQGQAGRAFVEALLDREGLGGDCELAELLFRRTAGLPLFATSFLRVLDEGGDGDVTSLRRALTDPSVPAEVESVFGEQLRRLPPELRTLLEATSVQGQRFAAEPLMEMFGLSRDRFAELVDIRLGRQLGLVWPVGSVTIAGRPMHRYEVSHVLLRDYLFDRLTPFQRADYHTRTAEALMARYGSERHDATEAIAWHLDQAGDTVRAAVAHLRAGMHATGIGQHERAQFHYDRVLQLDVRATDPATHIGALLGRGYGARVMGDARQAREMLEHGHLLAEAHGLPTLAAYALQALAMLDFDAGEMQIGVERITVVVDRFSAQGDAADVARALSNLGILLYGLGRFEEAERNARRAAEMADRVGNDRIWAEAWNTIGICRLDLGCLDEALAIHHRCIEVCTAIGDAHRRRLGWLNVAQALFEQERWEAAREAVGHVLDDPEVTSSRLVASGKFNAGVITEGLGDLGAARSHYETARHLRELNEQGAVLIDALAGLLRVAVKTGDLDRARALRGDIVVRIARRGLDGIEHVGRLYLTLIDASEALGESETAERYLRDALAFLQERASRLSDPAYRDSYLTNPPAHRRIAELAKAHGLDR